MHYIRYVQWHSKIVKNNAIFFCFHKLLREIIVKQLLKNFLFVQQRHIGIREGT